MEKSGGSKKIKAEADLISYNSQCFSRRLLKRKFELMENISSGAQDEGRGADEEARGGGEEGSEGGD